jgi:hypothetical protein
VGIAKTWIQATILDGAILTEHDAIVDDFNSKLRGW